MPVAAVREILEPDLVQIATPRTIRRGGYLFHAGEPARSVFVVVEGELEVLVGAQSTGETVVATVGPGHLVGELEALTGATRVASVLATCESTLLEIGTAQLETLLAESRPSATKLLRAIAGSLAQRLIAASERLAPRAGSPVAQDEEMQEPVSETDLDVLDRLWS